MEHQIPQWGNKTTAWCRCQGRINLIFSALSYDIPNCVIQFSLFWISREPHHAVQTHLCLPPWAQHHACETWPCSVLTNSALILHSGQYCITGTFHSLLDHPFVTELLLHSSIWLSGSMLLWTCPYRPSDEHMHTFLLAGLLGVETLGPMAGMSSAVFKSTEWIFQVVLPADQKWLKDLVAPEPHQHLELWTFHPSNSSGYVVISIVATFAFLWWLMTVNTFPQTHWPSG